ncbi:L,D-transpeptidase [Nocardia sp. BMG51109]|uniref:L,D-transpeptidase family protein n=1 Tax=Nocardia sp. BMG51109 TaxID=1056816 RepID=UPI00056ABDF9|nr:L,D-transpeptidase family protein [Nocardia sp. BMG51109]
MRRVALWSAVGAALAVAGVVGAVVLVPRIAGDGPPFDPETVPGTQVVWVTAPPGADHGTLELWQRDASRRWARTLTSPAWLGAQGISDRAREGSDYTPQGTFTITEGFGRLPGPDATLPYLWVDPSDTWWWVSDPASPQYNRKVRCAEADCPFDTARGENLGRTVPEYDRALVIDYNREPVAAGAGSAFFLHVDTGGPTAGCVAVAPDVVRTLLSTLQPSRQPVIGMYTAR